MFLCISVSLCQIGSRSALRGAARVAGWSREPARAITTAWGLSGRLHRGGDGATDDHVAFLEHAGLAYAVRLADRRGTSSVSVLRALLDSIEPIVVTGASGGAAAALHHWAA